MDIGTAKPDKEIMNTVKHHLFDIVSPDEYFNANMYIDLARNTINHLKKTNTPAIITGGSGFYIKGLLYGLSFLPELSGEVKKIIDDKISSNNIENLYNEISDIDPQYAGNISSRDIFRIRRFFEIYYSVKMIPTAYFAQNPPKGIDQDFIIFYLNKDRRELYENIEKRVDEMIKNGLVEEVEFLIKKGYGRNCIAMNSIGYSEIMDMLDDKICLREAIDEIKKNTRRFAKRQIIWFRKVENKHTVYSYNDILNKLDKMNGDYL